MPSGDELDTFWCMTSAKPLDKYAESSITDRRRVTPYHGSVANVEIDQDEYEVSKRRQSIKTVRSRAMSVLSLKGKPPQTDR